MVRVLPAGLKVQQQCSISDSRFLLCGLSLPALHRLAVDHAVRWVDTTGIEAFVRKGTKCPRPVVPLCYSPIVYYC